MTSSPAIRCTMLEPDIAVLTLDVPGKSANTLSSSVLQELSDHLDVLQPRDDLAGLIITSGKPDMFIAGADLREFVAFLGLPKEKTHELSRDGQRLLRRLSLCPFVTVAAIDGICVGGASELVSWCDRRLLTNNDKTQFGFPEVKLGLIPGWGGTVRAPRLVGLSNALELITSGDSIDSDTAALTGWCDDVVAVDQLLPAAVRLIRDDQRTGKYLADRKKWEQPLESNETELGFLGVTASAWIRQQTKGHYPAPMAALELMAETARLDVETACEKEASQLAALFGSPINAALLNVFFLQDRVKKDTGIEGTEVVPQPVESVGVIGAGIMGAGISAANVKRDVSVTLSDASRESLAKGAQQVFEEISYNKKTQAADVRRAIEKGPLLNLSHSDHEFSSCNLVVEAVVENLEIKQQVLQAVEKQLEPGAILASNTSTIPITTLAGQLQRPADFCGIHFFNPVRKMQLVEVIRGKQTSDLTVATAVAYTKQIGKLPIVVNDGPGFLVNRLLFPYMNEAIELLCEGVTVAQIERAAKSFGMPMGPVTLYDVVGIDTAVYAGRTIYEAFPDRCVVSPLLPAMVKAGRLGQKTGHGFFKYQKKKNRGQHDPEFDEFLQPFVRKKESLTPEQITARLFMPMLLEATRVLEEGIVRSARDVDLGLIFGIGFPPFKGGLLFWADTIPGKELLETLKPFESLGKRYQPTELLKDMIAGGQAFYDR
ncbi:MAG: 3-hydroxyacyl-CoA dehydrogenase NAD-binding domain-containing protein [Planctomycetota bacterium]|nr:3-hydroxyacyl-CoA dehydrogenase NAD-binding domain-containing protein [Planctomycetota bacterium]